MKITIESTDKVVDLVMVREGVRNPGLPARVWQGKTESGIPIHCFITRIGVEEGLSPEQYKQFESELVEQRRARPDVQAIPARLIL